MGNEINSSVTEARADILVSHISIHSNPYDYTRTMTLGLLSIPGSSGDVVFIHKIEARADNAKACEA